MVQVSFIRRTVLAAALALSSLGATAAVEGAAAMPAAAPSAQGATGTGLEAVQYRYRRYRRAGLYNCGPGGLNTHLARQACGTRSTAKQYLYRR